MYEKYGDQVEFFMVYIKEAHPTDGRQSQANVRENILIKQPTSLEERKEVASEMCSLLKIKLPPLVDTLDDKTNQAYSASPDRLYLVGVDGRIVYKGGKGPHGFDAQELKEEIEKVVNN
tara:strand:+ start:203 stop:559 length:357 start_codon:yes stop_codon:yes gene_type:complete